MSDRIWKDSFEDLAAVQAKQPDDKLELSRQEVLTAKDAIDRAIKNQDWNTTLAKLAELRKGISTGGRKDNWFSDDLATVRQAMGDLRAFYDAKLKPLIGGPPPKVCWALDEQAAEALPLLRRLLNQLFQEYQHLKDAMEALDFDDLEGKAAQLSRNKNVRARWQRGTRAVMVDEFQDTNSRQRQIVYGISGFDPVLHTKSLENSDGSASSSIFIVGDAKQSIYQFRGADVTVFRQVQSDIASANGIPLDLNLTFRSHKALLTSLNALLAPILGEKDDLSHPYQVPFAPLQAFRQAPESSAITAPFIEFILGLGEDASIGREAAAMALTDRLHKLHEQEGFEWEIWPCSSGLQQPSKSMKMHLKQSEFHLSRLQGAASTTDPKSATYSMPWQPVPIPAMIWHWLVCCDLRQLVCAMPPSMIYAIPWGATKQNHYGNH